jgi:N-acetyl-D-muramate 6-phosphate phosphatase
MLRTVLFDLDGTLLDTAPDLAAALNAVLREQGRPALPFDDIRPVVSHGTTGLLGLGFGLRPGEDEFESLRQRLLTIYAADLSRHTRLFPGMDQVLDHIEAQGMNWGVVTNKPSWLTEPLMANLGLSERAACIVSGDTTPQRKPDPEPMLHACHLAGSEAAQCIYIGDAERDIEAGRRAGMKTLAASFGYIGSDEDIAAWGADGIVDTPADILAWLTHPEP